MTAKGAIQEGSNTAKAVVFCSCEEGRTLHEIAAHIERSAHVTHSVLAPVLRNGRLIRAGIRPWSRYFSNREHAEAFEKIAADLVKAHREKKREQERERQREREKTRVRVYKPKEPVKPKKASTALKPSGLTLSTKRQDQERKREHIKATIIYPENYKYTKAPTPRDDRFTFTPPSKDWRGVISQDQQERWAA